MAEKEQRVKRVYEMPEVSAPQEEVTAEYRQKRVVAYCRVSTKQEEQLNSYETQRAAYIDMISKNPDWRLVKIFADKGITGTSVKNRDEFNKMIKLCKQGKVDMIITKSISRFARNTEDCLHYTRMLKRYGVDVYFEEQKLHVLQGVSIEQKTADFCHRGRVDRDGVWILKRGRGVDRAVRRVCSIGEGR